MDLYGIKINNFVAHYEREGFKVKVTDHKNRIGFTLSKSLKEWSYFRNAPDFEVATIDISEKFDIVEITGSLKKDG